MATVALVAASIATSVAANLLQGTSKPDSGNIDVPKSNYGVVLPQCWGRVEVAGNLLWATEIEPKKKGKNFGNFAVLFAHCPFNPAIEIETIKFNNKGAYTSVGNDPNSIDASAEFRDKYLRFYLGTDTQEPDPLIEALTPVSTYDHGLPADYDDRQELLANLGLPASTATVPGYRKKVYMVAEDLPLIDYGNQIPRIKAIIRFHDSIYLDQIVREICLQVGLKELDIEVSELASIRVEGFYIDKVMPAKDAIKLLQKSFFFDVFRSGGKLIFSLQSATRPSIQIPIADLAAHQLGKARPKTFEYDSPFVEDLPKRVEINFVNPHISFDTDNVAAETENPNAKRKDTHNLNVVMTEDHADAIAYKHLHKAWLENIKIKFTLPPAYGFLEVGDRPKIPLYGNLQTVELTKVQMGADRSLNCEAKLIESAAIEVVNNFTSTLDTGGYNDPLSNITIKTQGDTNLYILDINLIQDSDSDYGVYVTANGGENWQEASIYMSADDSRYVLVGSIVDKGAIGTLQSALDENSTSFTVQLESGEFESATPTDINLGFNKLLVGDEILQFQERSLTGTNTYQISNLTRGLRGTENYLNSHAIGERVVLLTGTDAVIERIPLSAADIGQVRYFKAPSPGQSLENADAIALTISGNSLKPYAPVNLAATVDNVGNITITWDRRDRHAGDRTDYANFPLSEAKEEWEIEVFDEDSLKRTINSFQKKTRYSVANQIADFGSLQNTMTVKVYQISIDVGRGYPATATLTPTFQESTPVITGFNPMSGVEGDTITVFGSGLAGVMAVNLAGIPANNIAVVNDYEVSFVIAPDTGSGLIEVITTDGSATSSNSLVTNSAIDTSDFMLKSVYDPDDDGIVDSANNNNSQPGTFGTFELTTQSLAQGSFENFDLEVGALVTIREISLSHQGRLRLFGTESDRISDTVDVNTSLNIDEAVDFYIAGNLTKKFFQGLVLNNLEEPTLNNLYGKVFNDSGSENAIAIAIKYYANASVDAGDSGSISSSLIGVGLRKINSSATKAIELRRASDNAVEDIGFDGDNLDIAAINSFLSGSDGYVTKLYVQGTSELFIQTDPAQQAKLLLAGINGKPALEFTGTQSYDSALQTNSNYSFQVVFALDALVSPVDNNTLILVSESNITGNSRGIFFGLRDANGNNSADLRFGHFKSVTGDFDQALYTDFVGVGSPKIVTAIREDGVNHSLYDRGSLLIQEACSSVTLPASNPIRIGEDYSTTNRHFIGKISEIIFDLDRAWEASKISDNATLALNYYFSS